MSKTETIPGWAFTWGKGVTERVKIPPEVAELVTIRQRGRFCVECRALALVTPPSVPLQLDHIQPIAKGGDNHHLNLRWLCDSHNFARRDRPIGRPRIPKWKRRATA